jgi:hypothetical protein
MDEILNPYAPGAGTPPPELAGRDQELRQFRTLLARLSAGRSDQGLALWGLRGVGKTVLLSAFRGLAADAGWGVGSYELSRRTALRAPLATLVTQAATTLARHPGIAGRLKGALKVIKSFSVTAMPTGVTFKLETDPEVGRGDTGQLDIDMLEVLRELGSAAQAEGVGVVLFIDEMQFAEPEDLSGLLSALHQVGQDNLPVAVVCAGLPQLPATLTRASSYAERLFSYVEIGKLTPDAARDALVLPAQRENVEYESEATEFILDCSGRYPFFLQTYGKYAWAAARESPITATDARNADAIAREHLDQGFHRARFLRATPRERQYLEAMAALGDGPQATGDIAKRLGVDASALSPVRAQLLETKGLIYSPDHGLVDFSAPLFGDFLRRHHPVED